MLKDGSGEKKHKLDLDHLFIVWVLKIIIPNHYLFDEQFYKFTLEAIYIMPRVGIILTLIVYVFMGICLLLMP